MELQCTGQPANCLGIDFVVPRLGPFADGPDDRRPGVGISEEFRARLRPRKPSRSRTPPHPGRPCRRPNQESEGGNGVQPDSSAHRSASRLHWTFSGIPPRASRTDSQRRWIPVNSESDEHSENSGLPVARLFTAPFLPLTTTRTRSRCSSASRSPLTCTTRNGPLGPMPGRSCDHWPVFRRARRTPRPHPHRCRCE